MPKGTVPPRPRKSKLAEQFEGDGFALEETEYEYLDPRGARHDLRALLRRVDRAFLGADRPFELPQVAWADLRAHNAWALYVIRDDVILVEKSLDAETTPRAVLRYLLLHELLHIAHPPDGGGSQGDWHTAEHEAALADFPGADEAEAWLEAAARRERERRVPRRPAAA
ncbi:MAG TPA: hypothetical protein VGB42_12640 [Candidatus Thermoplasmatota archaeon]